MKSTINRDNYEPWALDYLEGTLSETDQMRFESFLDDHPDIKAEILGMDLITLDPPDKTVFRHKEKLYRRSPKVRPLYLWVGSIAAGLALLIGVRGLLNSPDLDSKNHDTFTEISYGEKEITPELQKEEIAVLNNSDASPSQEETKSKPTSIIQPSRVIVAVDSKPEKYQRRENTTAESQFSFAVSNNRDDVVIATVDKPQANHREMSHAVEIVQTLDMPMKVNQKGKTIVLRLSYDQPRAIAKKDSDSKSIKLRDFLPEVWETESETAITAANLPSAFIPDIFTND